MADDPSTRATLLVRLRDHRDRAAWVEFVELYGPLVRRLARQSGLQPADAADLEQEVFRAVAAAIDRFNPDPAHGSFRGWLHAITRNMLINWLAAQRKHPRATGDSAHARLLAEQVDPALLPGDTSHYENEYRRRLFQWASDRVRGDVQETTWLAFWKTAVEGRSPADVAATLGLSVGAVYVNRNRVMARIRSLIAEFGDPSALDHVPSTA